MAGRKDIGDHLILFYKDGGNSNTDLVISAHGGYWARPELGKQTGCLRNIPGFGGWFKVPVGETLHFYVPHKYVLDDPEISNALQGLTHKFESSPAGTLVRNYRLNKYQGKHGNEQETYNHISQSIDDPRAFFDVLTIKNRWWKIGGITLKAALEQLSKATSQYSDIYCLFCRSRINGPSPGSHDAMSPLQEHFIAK